MIAFYDNKPSKLEAIGNGSYVYRYNIEVSEIEVSEEEPDRTQWQCEEVTVWSPLSANKITEKVITDKWGNNREQKFINEYNAAKLGLYGGSASSAEAREKIAVYRQYLNERDALKAVVDDDCEELGIL